MGIALERAAGAGATAWFVVRIGQQVSRPLTRPVNSAAQLHIRRGEDDDQSVRLGSTFSAIVLIGLAAALLGGAAGSPIPRAPLAEYMLLVTVGYVAATATRQAEPHLRRLGIHHQWRSATAAYVAATAILTIFVPASFLLLVQQWRPLNQLVAGIGRQGGSGASLPVLRVDAGLDGAATVFAAAVACALVPWLMTVKRQQLSPRQRAFGLVVVVCGVGCARLLVTRSLGLPTTLVTMIPPVEAVILGAAVAAVPRSFIHRNPPQRLWIPATAIAVAALLAPTRFAQPGLIVGVASVLAVAGLAVALTADRLGLTPSSGTDARLGRLVNHVASLVPAAVVWHTAIASLIVGRFALNSAADQGVWTQIVMTAASVALSLSAAGVTKSHFINPLRESGSKLSRSQPSTALAGRRIAQLLVVDEARFSSMQATQWDEQQSRSIGRPLPVRPAVPIRTSRIVHRHSTTRAPHRGRRTKRDQIPPPERRTRAGIDEDRTTQTPNMQAETTTSVALDG